MEFNSVFKKYFYAVKGAYSLVTHREHFDSQITLTGLEAEIAIDYFGRDNIHNDNVKSDPKKASKQFYLYSGSEEINLNLIFPKHNKPELRLYLSDSKGFKPQPGEVWFIYLSMDNKLVIGAMNSNKWNSIGDIDDIDPEYIEEIIEETTRDIELASIPDQGKIKETNIKGRTRYARDPRIALKRLSMSDYKCEVDSNHETFISSRTNKPFVEAHHLIPMGYQSDFIDPLDNIYNIFSLCPNCHRAIHYSTPENKRNLLEILYGKRKEIQEYNFETLTELYNCIAPKE